MPLAIGLGAGRLRPIESTGNRRRRGGARAAGRRRPRPGVSAAARRPAVCL
ncbi:MAG: hypothetical protein MZW92_54915 [Comamonadaceae bacterium]|nr:hypothetical protein [Comamonadaceae bacterium]